jgi:serine/threonine protein kinase
MGAAATSGSSLTKDNIHETYPLAYQIGSGAFSDVFLSTTKTNQTKVAVKRIHLARALANTTGLQVLSNELQVFKQMGCHDNIVKLHCAYRLKNHFYFVMDCLLGGDLRHYILANGMISQHAIAYIMTSLGSGLHHMHQRGVIHRDIKPENIALDCKGKPYLTDFGISHRAATTDSWALISNESSGTLPYLAPEVLTRTHEHSYQSDFWSLGIMGYELLFGKRPFDPHVPLDFIYFAANNYHKMWEHLLHGLLVPTTEEMTMSQTELPFPHYRITLNDDGTIPDSLCVPIPTVRVAPEGDFEHVDQDMVDLMRGLLDVRITDRLGSLKQFHDFSHHPIFVHYNYHTSYLLRTTTSPLLKEDWSGILSNEIRGRSFPKPTETEAPLVLDSTVNSELDNLFYIRNRHGDTHSSSDTISWLSLPSSSAKYDHRTQLTTASVLSPGRSVDQD